MAKNVQFHPIKPKIEKKEVCFLQLFTYSDRNRDICQKPKKCPLMSKNAHFEFGADLSRLKI